MARKEKFKRKQLKQQDQFLSVTEQVTLFLSKHKKNVIAAVTAGVVIFVAVLGFRYNQQVQSMRMEALYFEMGEILKQKDKDRAAVVSESKEKLAEFSSGPQKLRAELLLADAYHRFGEYSEAIPIYNRILDSSRPDELHYQIANIGLAYAYEGTKDYKKGIEVFKSIIDSGSGFPLFDVYLSLARCYELDQNPDKALLILREMQSRFEGHPQSKLVDNRIKKISAEA